jgi:SEC-C motif-containing protein
MTTSCPCHSGKKYHQCCEPFHKGDNPLTALQLMRSRYSAYAKGLTDYIISTTHPDNPSCKKDHEQWKKEITLFCNFTEFRDLEISEFTDGEKEAYVTFTAYLDQNQQDTTFTERSRFLKEGERWLYRDSSYH